MGTLCGATVVKSFDYRDDPAEEFSSKYWFKGAPPQDDPGWQALLGELLGLEQAIYDSTVSFVRFYGYADDANDANHVFAHDWTVPGPAPKGTMVAGTIKCAGDQAALVQWKTNHVNKRGKPIYLRKYIHGGYLLPADHDKIDTGWHANLQAYADNVHLVHGGMTNASSSDDPGANPGWPGGSHTTMVNLVSPWITTRTLKRRGKRPKVGN